MVNSGIQILYLMVLALIIKKEYGCLFLINSMTRLTCIAGKKLKKAGILRKKKMPLSEYIKVVANY